MESSSCEFFQKSLKAGYSLFFLGEIISYFPPGAQERFRVKERSGSMSNISAVLFLPIYSIISEAVPFFLSCVNVYDGLLSSFTNSFICSSHI